MKKKVVIVLDCGATNLRAIAVDDKGSILAAHSFPNNTSDDPFYPDYKIWDVKEIWTKLSEAVRKIIQQINDHEIAAVTVTTFGVDGAPFDVQGKQLYPVISWACKRTEPVMQNISKYIPFQELYALNGVNEFCFNTLYKLIWFRENKPEILEKMDHFAFISSIFLNFLSGEWVTESTMAGTSMLTDYKTANFSELILNKIGLDKNKFRPIVNAGEMIGRVTDKASLETGLPIGTPVVAAGHDTQFAIFGSGADENEAVLSSGTWEILMTRTRSVSTNEKLRKAGVTIELDAIPGLYNPGMQWLGSGIVEWIKNTFYAAEKNKKDIYSLMISEAESCKDACISISPDFINHRGSVSGLGLNSNRAEIFRALLETLSVKTKQSLAILEDSCGFKADSLICVGGGSKNDFWNQLRANALGIPVKTISVKETTVLGAALFAFYGTGYFNSPEEARSQINYNTQIFHPEL